jgi:hypothetical protein
VQSVHESGHVPVITDTATPITSTLTPTPTYTIQQVVPVTVTGTVTPPMGFSAADCLRANGQTCTPTQTFNATTTLGAALTAAAGSNNYATPSATPTIYTVGTPSAPTDRPLENITAANLLSSTQSNTSSDGATSVVALQNRNMSYGLVQATNIGTSITFTIEGVHFSSSLYNTIPFAKVSSAGAPTYGPYGLTSYTYTPTGGGEYFAFDPSGWEKVRVRCTAVSGAGTTLRLSLSQAPFVLRDSSGLPIAQAPICNAAGTGTCTPTSTNTPVTYFTNGLAVAPVIAGTPLAANTGQSNAQTIRTDSNVSTQAMLNKTPTANNALASNTAYQLSSNVNTANTAILFLNNLSNVLDIKFNVVGGVDTATLTVTGCTDSTCSSGTITIDSISAAASGVKHYNASTVGATTAISPLSFPWVQVSVGAAAHNFTSLTVTAK